jgi:hypothetical protein
MDGRQAHRVGFQPCRVPEAGEAGAALVRGKAAPQQFAAHFVIQADHESLDELWIGLQQRHCLGRHKFQARKQQILRKVAQHLVHGTGEGRGTHHQRGEIRTRFGCGLRALCQARRVLRRSGANPGFGFCHQGDGRVHSL